MQKQKWYPILLLSFASITARGQIPTLTVKNAATEAVSLQTLNVNVVIAGSVAKTTWEMTFYNNTYQTLEGNLDFPLPEGISISDYALDINGHMRDAVAVEKEKGTTAFENLETKKIDPGLMERTEGNNFRTRIYPFRGHGTRTVRIGYEENLAFAGAQMLQYRLPLAFSSAIAKCRIKVQVLQNGKDPVIIENPDKLFAFTEKGDDYTASIEKDNYTPSKPLLIQIPKQNDKPEAFMQQYKGGYYFLVNSFPVVKSRVKPAPSHITIFWDASLSALTRAHDKELALLGDYFAQIKNVSVNLVSFSNRVRSVKTYTVEKGNWAALKKDIEGTIYDGGTNFGILDTKKWPADEYLLFSDGNSNYGNDQMPASAHPVFCINSAEAAGYANMRNISNKSGGAVIDLNKLSGEEAKKMLCNEQFRFLGIKHDAGIDNVYPSMPVTVENGIAVAGVSNNPNKEITLQFGYGNKVTYEQKVKLDEEMLRTSALNVPRVHAQKEISELELAAAANDDELLRIGKEFGIVTKNTSLIVLEDVNDYVRYGIEPPAELREQYYAIVKNAQRATPPTDSALLETANVFWYNIHKWYLGDDSEVKYTPLKHQAFQAKEQNSAPKIPNSSRDNLAATTTTAAAEPEVAMRNKDKTMLQTVEIRRTKYNATPLRNEFVSAQILDKEAINRMPLRNTADIAATTIGVFQTKSGADIRIAGARAEGTLYVIDGVQVSGSNNINLPPGSIEQMEVVTGGIPAKYGDATGGMVIINSSSMPGYKYRLNEYELMVEPIRKASAAKKYNAYLKARESFLQNPVFYFQAASYFIAHDQRELGIQILSNMAELSFENYEVYKMIGYKLREIDEKEDAIYVFRKLLEWRSMDPQSFRDYGLALSDGGYYQRSFDTLYGALTKFYDQQIAERNSGVQEVIITEMNNLVNLHGDVVDAGKMPEEWKKAIPMDMRVVLNWNKASTDIDLAVVNPRGEKCFYGNKETKDGGRISNDFTQGFGPEQYILKRSKNGKYEVALNYFGDQQVTQSGPTTVQAELYTDYGTPAQQRKLVTMQMTKNSEGNVWIGEIKF